MPNLATAVRNRAAKLLRDSRRRVLRMLGVAGESGRRARGQMRRGRAGARDSLQQMYAGGVKTGRAVERWRVQTWARTSTELSVRAELRRAARGTAPILVGPWLGEVGYEALYWVPFVRWFTEHYRVDPNRLVVVSRGGVRTWYADITDHYVELFDLVTPADLRQASEQRSRSGDQKQLAISDFDQRVIDRVQGVVGRNAGTLHPSTMFRLFRRFWTGSESLQFVLEHSKHRLLDVTSHVECPPLPTPFVAVKFYSGRAMPESVDTRSALRTLLERVRCGRPIVALDTALRSDEHHDYQSLDLPDVWTLASHVTPQNNLAIQTEVIRRAELFIGTCGSLAWLAPIVGTPTLAVYADDHLLAPHLYAAREVYASIRAADFTPIDIAVVKTLAAVEASPLPGRP